MKKTVFGTVGDQEYMLYSFTNVNNMTMELTDFGGTLVRLLVPDKNGIPRDVVLGYDTPQGYINGGCFFGAIIGRSGNRIGKAQFTIGEKTYQLAVNDNDNNLHSGPDCFHLRKWEVEAIDETANSIRFGLLSPDGDQGYPGEFKVAVTFTLTDDNEVVMHYEGTSDADTIANMTNHSYFNLNGHESGQIIGHELMMTAQAYTPVVDSQAIPTGELAPVAGTPMDFTTVKTIGRDIEADFEQLSLVLGYDHNYVLAEQPGTVQTFAEAYGPETGIAMQVTTDCCGVQFYSGNHIKEEHGKDGVVYTKRQGFCLETQFFPNSINQEGFASPLLTAGEKYDTKTIYKFENR